MRGHNSATVGICYEGGLDASGKAKDTRTAKQKASLLEVIKEIIEHESTQIETIKGHRDYSPDLDGDGEIEEHEWLKQCPCFDAKNEYQWILV